MIFKIANSCPFCDVDKDRVLYEDEFCYVVRDGYPVSEGHTLIISKNHIGSFFESTEDEKKALINALNLTKKHIDNEFSPDAYNVGINDGKEAGQTISHMHIHLIPRYKGDVPDPKGGVRWVVPDKAAYWER